METMELQTKSAFQAWHVLDESLTQQGRYLVLFGNQSLSTVRQLDALIISLFHGDEPEAYMLGEAFLEQVEQGQYQSEMRIGVIPLLNPDGLLLKQRTNASGVDLNRNFPTQDWVEQEQGTPYYSGPKAASEFETQFVIRILDQFRPKRILTLHTPYDVINYDGPGLELAQAMAAVNGMPVVEDIGYPTPGSFGTYAGKERGIPTLTLELPEGTAFTAEVLAKNLAAIYQFTSVSE